MPLENKCTLLQVSPAEVHDYEEKGFLSKKEMHFYEQNNPSDLSRQSVQLIFLLHSKKKRPVPHRWLKIEPWVSASTKTPTPAPMTPPVLPYSTSLATASRAVWRSRPIAIHWWTCHLVRRHRARAVLCALTRSSSESTRSSCATTPLHPVLPSASAGNTTRRIPSKLN